MNGYQDPPDSGCETRFGWSCGDFWPHTADTLSGYGFGTVHGTTVTVDDRVLLVLNNDLLGLRDLAKVEAGRPIASRDGRFLLLPHRIVDTATVRPLDHPWPPVGVVVGDFCLSHDDRRVLVADGTRLTLVDLAASRILSTWDAPTNVRALCLFPDGRFAATGDPEGSVHVWAVATGRCVGTFSEHRDSVDSLSVSADGRLLLSGGREGDLRLWELDWEHGFPERANWNDGATPFLRRFLMRHSQRGVDGVFGVTDPEWTQAAFEELLLDLARHGFGWLRPQGIRRELNRRASRWEPVPPLFLDPTFLPSEPRDEVVPFPAPSTPLCEGASSPIATCRPPRLAHHAAGHTATVESITALPDHQVAVSAGADLTLRVWDLASGLCLHTLRGHTAVVYQVVAVPASTHVVSIAKDGTARLWDVKAGALLHTLRGHTCRRLAACAVTPDGRFLATSAYTTSEDDGLLIWDLDAPGKPVRTLPALRVEDAVFTADGNALIHTVDGVNHPDAIVSWHWRTGHRIAETNTEHPIRELHTRDQRVYTLEDDRFLRAYDLDTMERVASIEGDKVSMRGMTLSADARWAATVGWRGPVRLWDLAHERAIHEIAPPGEARQTAVAFAQNSSRLVTGHEDGSVAIYELHGRA